MRKLRRRVSLLTRFGLISFALVVVLGVAVGEVLHAALRDRAVADAVRTAQVAANIGVRPVLRPSDLEHVYRSLPDARRAQLDAALLESLSKNNIVRLKIWNSQHFVVWSDNKRLLQRKARARDRPRHPAPLSHTCHRARAALSRGVPHRGACVP